MWFLTAVRSVPTGMCRAEGMIKNFNTIEEFKKADRPAMLKKSATTVWDTSTLCTLAGLLMMMGLALGGDTRRYNL